MAGEPCGAEGIVGEPVESFGLHAAAPEADDATDREGENDVPVAAGEVANSPWPGVVDLLRGFAAGAADSFWGWACGWSVITTADGSSGLGVTSGRGVKPGKR